MKLFIGFVVFLIPLFVSANVIINEIAWMGTAESSYCEWVELYNDASANIDLSGWGLYEVGSSGDVLIMTLTQPIAAVGYYLIERVTPSCPDPVSGIAADDAGSFGGSGLSNSGEILILKNVSSDEADRVEGSDGWHINGGADIVGNNTTKETMQRTLSGDWITAVATPRAANEVVANQEAGGNTSNVPQTFVVEEPAVIQEQKRFFTVDAGKDINTVAGAEVRFSGAAFGFTGEPLQDDAARYLWNFGDGAFFEAKNANHIYRYPGAYRAALYVSSGQTSGNDVSEVAVGESSVVISEIAGAWIELVNEGTAAVDMSSWQIRNGAGQIYTLPAYTIIGPAAFVVFSQETAGLLFGPVNPKAELRYANGAIADALSFAGTLLPDLSAQAGKSITRGDEGSAVLGEQTPGRKNKMYHVAGSAYQGEILKAKIPTQKIDTARVTKIQEEKSINKKENPVIHDTNYRLPAKIESSIFASNYFWLAASISIGLLAGAVALALRAMVLF